MSAHCIQGVLAAAITPRHESTGAVDCESAIELAQFLESHGVDGLALFGSTGEFVHFDAADRARLVDTLSKRTRLPLLVNASHSTLDGAVRIAREAADRGAAGVMILPPYYFRYNQEAIRAFCLEFAAQATGPVYLYNIPFFTNPLDLDTALGLLRTGAFAGIKDSGGRWDHFVALDQAAAERHLAVLVGNDAIYGWAAKAGAAGAVSGVASAVPELMVAVDRVARAGGDTSELDALVQEFIDRVLRFPLPIAIREAAAIRGIRTGPHASPLGDDDTRALQDFRGWFRDWLPGVEAAASAVVSVQA
jgi:dihydrodipicolinate synthase/N-acetylneuraminate lyase